MEKEDVLNLLLKEERVADVSGWGRRGEGEFFQTWWAKCEKVRKPWVLRVKRWSLSMRVSHEEFREREGL